MEQNLEHLSETNQDYLPAFKSAFLTPTTTKRPALRDNIFNIENCKSYNNGDKLQYNCELAKKADIRNSNENNNHLGLIKTVLLKHNRQDVLIKKNDYMNDSRACGRENRKKKRKYDFIPNVNEALNFNQINCASLGDDCNLSYIDHIYSVNISSPGINSSGSLNPHSSCIHVNPTLTDAKIHSLSMSKKFDIKKIDNYKAEGTVSSSLHEFGVQRGENTLVESSVFLPTSNFSVQPLSIASSDNLIVPQRGVIVSNFEANLNISENSIMQQKRLLQRLSKIIKFEIFI